MCHKPMKGQNQWSQTSLAAYHYMPKIYTGHMRDSHTLLKTTLMITEFNLPRVYLIY